MHGIFVDDTVSLKYTVNSWERGSGPEYRTRCVDEYYIAVISKIKFQLIDIICLFERSQEKFR